MCTLKFCCYYDNHLEKNNCRLFWNEHFLNFLSSVQIFLCTDGIGLGSSKSNTTTFCNTSEIHEFLLEILGG